MKIWFEASGRVKKSILCQGTKETSFQAHISMSQDPKISGKHSSL